MPFLSAYALFGQFALWSRLNCVLVSWIVNSHDELWYQISCAMNVWLLIIESVCRVMKIFCVVIAALLRMNVNV